MLPESAWTEALRWVYALSIRSPATLAYLPLLALTVAVATVRLTAVRPHVD